jgi:KilA-N domain
MNTTIVVRSIGHFPIGQRVTDGFINATVLCKACGKEWADFWRLKGTQEFIEALESDLGIPRSLLVQTVKGVTTGMSPKDQGTWVHPDIAVSLAQWCSPKFAVMVSRWVREWLTTGTAPVKATRLPVYVKRFQLAFRMQMTVPDGYWTVFDKCSNLLILVECDLKLPVDDLDLLDGSVGICYSRFRPGKEWAVEKKTYEHLFPDRRGIRKANAYSVSELPFFEQWLKNVYIQVHLPTYLESKYVLPMPAKELVQNAIKPRLHWEKKYAN